MAKPTFFSLVKQMPVVGPLMQRCASTLRRQQPTADFHGSADYWDQRYVEGGNSGRGSYGELAEFKARVLNEFVRNNDVKSVIEFGCGDGNQLQLAEYPSYLGLDVSMAAVTRCREHFSGDATKSFRIIDEYAGEKADLSMSLDVIYHLVEDEVFHRYMSQLFDAAGRHVVIYASNFDKPVDPAHPHVRHRRFTDWISHYRPTWKQTEHIANPYPFNEQEVTGSFADFYFFAAP